MIISVLAPPHHEDWGHNPPLFIFVQYVVSGSSFRCGGTDNAIALYGACSYSKCQASKCFINSSIRAVAVSTDGIEKSLRVG